MNPNLRPLSVESINGGEPIEMINQALRKCALDVIERPFVKKAREATLKITIVPALIGEGTPNPMNVPEIETSVSVRLPGRKGSAVRAFVDQRNCDQLLLNPGDPIGTDPNQTTVFDKEFQAKD